MQASTVSRWRLLPLAVLSALAAAALSGSCTGYADESDGPGAVVTAVLLAGGVALTISVAFLLLAPNLRRAKLLAAVCVTAYLAAGFGAWFLFIWPLVVALVITVAGGRLAYTMTRTAPDSRAGRAAITTIATLAIGVSACIVVIVFWFNYDLCIGFFGVSCSRSELNVVPFALTLGGVPPIAGVLAGLMTNRFSGPEQDLRLSARPIPQPSIATQVKVVAGAAVCVAVASAIGEWYLYADSLSPGLVLGSLFTGAIVAIVGALLVTLAPDRRVIWPFAVIIVSVAAVDAIGIRLDLDVYGNPWGMVAGLAMTTAGAGAAAYVVRRRFDADGRAMWTVGLVSAVGILLAALSPGFLYSLGWLPYLDNPLLNFGALLPPAAAVIVALLTGRVCRT